MRYLLLIYGCDRPGEDSARAEVRAEVNAFLADCARQGVLLAADPLHAADTTTTVQVRDGQPLVTDGPFAETAEQLGGYLLVDCDHARAVELAARSPWAVRGAVLEVRPILELTDVAGVGVAAGAAVVDSGVALDPRSR